MSKYAALIFDLDDTLISFDYSEKYGLSQLHTQFFSQVNNIESLIKAYGPINHQLWEDVAHGRYQPAEVAVLRFKRLGESFGLTVDAAAVSKAYEHYISEAVYWYEGAEAAWHELASQYRLAIITNGLSKAQQKKIELMGVVAECEVILISEDEGMAKPDVRLFNKVINRLGLDVTDCLMIGDSLISDYQGAINAKMDFCWVSHGKALPASWPVPAYIVNSVAALSKQLLFDHT